jgi:hypothetical protein
MTTSVIAPSLSCLSATASTLTCQAKAAQLAVDTGAALICVDQEPATISGGPDALQAHAHPGSDRNRIPSSKRNSARLKNQSDS